MNTLETLFKLLKQELALRDAVLVTVVDATNSTPRKAGAKMLVTAEGLISGSVGGGIVEHKAVQMAQAALRKKQCMLHKFELHPGTSADIGMVCGGEQTLYFQYLRHGNPDALATIDMVLSSIRRLERAWLVTDEETGQMRVCGAEFALPATPSRIMLDQRGCFSEPLQSSGILYIFGGGHVAQELVPAASRVGFRCIVLDDRPEFTDPALFPGALAAMQVDFEHISAAISVQSNDYVAIMTRGHKFDSAVEAQILRTDAAYIGIMGSRAKKAFVEAGMRELGFSDTDLRRVKTPIGLDIKAETPAEIAVSIVAELIRVRAEHTTSKAVFNHNLL